MATILAMSRIPATRLAHRDHRPKFSERVVVHFLEGVDPALLIAYVLDVSVLDV
jgi:hypothetical protein